MADVHDAVDAETGRRVAVKVLRSIEPDHLQRFERELDALKALDHPAVVALLDHGEHEGQPFLVLERCDGGSLADALARRPLGAERAGALGAELAAGLAHAHARGVVHRDVKPANVLLCEDGAAKLGDFGIARITDAAALTGTGFTVGTAAYLAPEQARGEAVGPPADVYSLGLVVLEAATGHRAFEGTGMAAAVARLQRGPDIPDDLPSELVTTVAAMTAMNPDDRPTAAAAAARLHGSFDHDAAVDDGTAVLPLLADPTAVVPAVPATATGGTGGFWARLSMLPRWVVPFACFLVGFLAVLAVGFFVAGDDGGAPATTTTTTAPTTTATTAPPTTTTTAPPPADDDEDGDGRGNGNGNGNGNGRGGGGGDD